jgi:hypothetical protein
MIFLVSANTNIVSLPSSDDKLYAGEEATIQGFGQTKDGSAWSKFLWYISADIMTKKRVS